MYTFEDPRINIAHKNHAELHGSMSLLLPAFTNGTLDGDEQRALAKHLAICPECYRELCALSGIRELMCAEDKALQPNTDIAFGKLLGMIEAQRRNEPSTLKNLIELFRELCFGMVFSFRGAVALQILFIGLLAFAWLDAGEKVKTGYYTLSDPVELNAPTESPAAVTAGVIFDGNISVVAIQDALAEVDASIVAGPNTMGMYRINVGTNIEETRNWIKKLRESRTAIFAEITDTRQL